MSAVLPQKRVWTYYAKRRLIWISSITVSLIFLVWLVWELSPDNQVRKSFHQFTRSVENRDWQKVQSLIAVDYRDQWGFDREQAIEAGREILQQFLVIGIDPGKPVIQRKDNDATVIASLRLSGRGSALAEAAKDRVNSLQEPFHFAWRREGWQSWKLVSVTQPGLQYDASQLP